MTGDQLNDYFFRAAQDFYDPQMKPETWIQKYPYTKSAYLYHRWESGRIRGGPEPWIRANAQQLDRIYRNHFSSHYPVPHDAPTPPYTGSLYKALGYLMTAAATISAGLLLRHIQQKRRQQLRKYIEDNPDILSEILLDQDFTDISNLLFDPPKKDLTVFHGHGVGPDGEPGIQIQLPPPKPAPVRSSGFWITTKRPTADTVVVLFFYDDVYSQYTSAFTARYEIPLPDRTLITGFRTTSPRGFPADLIYSSPGPKGFPRPAQPDPIGPGWVMGSWSFSISQQVYHQAIINNVYHDLTGLPVAYRTVCPPRLPHILFGYQTAGGWSEAWAMSNLIVTNYGRPLPVQAILPKPSAPPRAADQLPTQPETPPELIDLVKTAIYHAISEGAIPATALEPSEIDQEAIAAADYMHQHNYDEYQINDYIGDLIEGLQP